MGRFSNLTRIHQEANTLSTHYLGVSERSLSVKSSNLSIGALAGAVSSSRVFEETQAVQEAMEQYRHYKGWVYTAVKTIANRLAGQAYGVGKRLNGKKPSKNGKLYEPVGGMTPAHIRSHLMATQIEVVQSHEFLTALRRPNFQMTASSLFYSTAASMMLTGRAFWWKRKKAKGRLELWPVPSHWVTFVYDKDYNFKHYAVKRPNSLREAEPVEVPEEDMMFFPVPDPSDPLNTTSALQTQATAVAVDEALQMAQFRAFKNGIFPGVMIQVGKFDGMAGMPGEVPLLSPDQRKDLVGAIQALYGGVLNYGDPLILDALIEKVERFTHTPMEMDFLESGEAIKKRIFQAFGVNPILTGQTDGANRAQAAVADGIFCNGVVNPLSDTISQVVSAHLAEKDEDMIFWIEPARPNDEELKLKEWLGAAAQLFVTPNEYRRNVLGLDELTAEDEADLKQLMALRVMGKPNAGTSGGSAQSATSSGGASRG